LTKRNLEITLLSHHRTIVSNNNKKPTAQKREKTSEEKQIATTRVNCIKSNESNNIGNLLEILKALLRTKRMIATKDQQRIIKSLWNSSTINKNIESTNKRGDKIRM
jgi:hypothetical protein